MPFDSILIVASTAAVLLWAALSAHVLAVGRRRERARALLSSSMASLRLDEIRHLPVQDRLAHVRPLLDRASRELVMQAASDPGTPSYMFETFVRYLIDRWGEDELVRDAASHQTAREKWRRMAALRILSSMGHPRRTELLAAAIDEPDAEIAGAAVAALGAVHDAAAIDLLIQALRRHRHSAARIAMHLERTPLGIADRLKPLLQDEDALVRFWGATLLGRYDDVAGVERDLARLAGDDDPRVRKGVVESLGKIGRSPAGSVAVRLLKDPVPFVRAHAARALARLDEPDIARHLTPLLGDPDWWVRLAAKESLESIGPEVWSVLFRCLDHPDRFVRNGAAEVFQNIGVLDSLVVMEAASDNPAPDKIAMLRRIAAAGGARLTDSLVERAGPVVGPRVRRLLDTIGLEYVGAA